MSDYERLRDSSKDNAARLALEALIVEKGELRAQIVDLTARLVEASEITDGPAQGPPAAPVRDLASRVRECANDAWNRDDRLTAGILHEAAALLGKVGGPPAALAPPSESTSQEDWDNEAAPQSWEPEE